MEPVCATCHAFLFPHIAPDNQELLTMLADVCMYADM